MTTVYEERMRRAWTQKRLAFEAGIDARTLRKIEKGQPVSLETIRAVCSVLDIAPSELVGVKEIGVVEGIATSRDRGRPAILLLSLSVFLLAALGTFRSDWLLPLLAAASGTATVVVAIWDAPGRGKANGRLAGLLITLNAGLAVSAIGSAVPSYAGSQMFEMALCLLFAGLILLFPSLTERLLPFRTRPDEALRRLFLVVAGVMLYACGEEHLFYLVSQAKHLIPSIERGLVPKYPALWTPANYTLWTLVAVGLVACNVKSIALPLSLLAALLPISIMQVSWISGEGLEAWVGYLFYRSPDLLLFAISLALSRSYFLPLLRSSWAVRPT